MDLPKCKICGEKHRLGPCPQPKSSGRTDEAKARESSVLVGAKAHAPPLPAQAGVGSERSSPETKFDRDEYHRNYMRDYMRKRRAKK